MRDTKDDEFINDIMNVVEEYLVSNGDASLLVNYFLSVANTVQRQIIEQEGKRPTLH